MDDQTGETMHRVSISKAMMVIAVVAAGVRP
jgi:hypothetical protein